MSPFLNPAFIVAILIAVTMHEWAHAFAAYRLGDSTAKYAGRLSLNPFAHLDPIGTLMFVVVGFGWAKPVPVDPSQLRDRKHGNMIVALAGPLSNFIVAWIAFLGLLLLGWHAGRNGMGLLAVQAIGSPVSAMLAKVLASSLFVNLGLMAFNLLPITPLDGATVVEPFVPLRYQDAFTDMMRRGPMILIGLLVAEHLIGIPLISGWVFGIMNGVLQLMSTVASLVLP